MAERGFEQKYSSEALARAIEATYVANPERDLKMTLQQMTNNLMTNNRSAPPVIVMMGAGTISDLTPKILK